MARRTGYAKTLLAVAILVGLGAWLGGSGVLASGGKGSSAWERLVRTFTPGQSGDQAGKTARPGDRAGRDTKHPDITKDLPSANDIN